MHDRVLTMFSKWIYNLEHHQLEYFADLECLRHILLVDRMSWKPNNNYDGQNNFKIETGAIEFFLSAFLGCYYSCHRCPLFIMFSFTMIATIYPLLISYLVYWCQSPNHLWGLNWVFNRLLLRHAAFRLYNITIEPCNCMHACLVMITRIFFIKRW